MFVLCIYTSLGVPYIFVFMSARLLIIFVLYNAFPSPHSMANREVTYIVVSRKLFERKSSWR